MPDNEVFPEGVFVDAATGALSSSSGHYVRRLSELRSIYSARAELDRLVDDHGDPVVYEVVEYKKPGSDIFFGTTTMNPGQVAGEFYMTRGHFHERRDMGEVYYTQHGKGVLLLESREGQTRIVDMSPGVCAFIPPDWAHRSINVGTDKLVFVWVCNVAAGQNYADILKKGMRKRVVERDGKPELVDNSAYG